jgi:asparagine synthase (glutamine-hydrolysing)
MQHRGPDAQGIFEDASAVLSHCRLSIIDPLPRGDQPMTDATGRYHISFNGEIYNYEELRDRYLASYRLRTETDTEVLLGLYDEMGTACLSELKGMFAFAIWDGKKERLLLTRDRMGQKPLYYHRDGGAITFGSTISAILADPAVTAPPDHSAIREYLRYQYVPSPSTGFSGIRQLPPGEYMIVDQQGVDRGHYWSLPPAKFSGKSIKKLQADVRNTVRDAVRLRLRSDVPLGVFLSGGLDSSITVAMMHELGVKDIQSFSIGFADQSYDERQYAEIVANHFDTTHHVKVIEPTDASIVPELVRHFEMPFGDSTALPTYLLAEFASDYITVALSGDASDESFAGYSRYRYMKALALADMVPRSLSKLGAQTLRMVPEIILERVPRVDALERFLRRTDFEIADRYLPLIQHADQEYIDRIDSVSPHTDTAAPIARLFDASAEEDPVTAAMAVDLQSYLPNNGLVKVDRASMAHAVEVRSPFLDRRVIELARQISHRKKLERFNSKAILKKAFRGYLPDVIIDRPKSGFGVPVGDWFRGPLRSLARDAVETLGGREQWDKSAMTSVFEEHISGECDSGAKLWDLVILAEWYEQYHPD